MLGVCIKVKIYGISGKIGAATIQGGGPSNRSHPEEGPLSEGDAYLLPLWIGDLPRDQCPLTLEKVKFYQDLTFYF